MWISFPPPYAKYLEALQYFQYLHSCIPLYCCYFTMPYLNSSDYNSFSQWVTDYISGVRGTLDIRDQVSDVINVSIIMGKPATASKGKPSIPFSSFASACSSASICHNRHDHSLSRGTSLKFSSRMGEIQKQAPGFNNTEEGWKSKTLQVSFDHSNSAAIIYTVWLRTFLVFKRKLWLGTNWKLPSLPQWRGKCSILSLQCEI